MDSLLRIQNELAVPKSQHNSFGNYNYRNCEQIMEAVKPLLQRENATIQITDKVVLLGKRFYLKSTAIYHHEGYKSTSVAYAREQDSKKGMDEAQVTGAASSYARKYALCALLLLDGGDDPDKMNNNESATEKTPKKAPTAHTPSELSEAQQKIASAKSVGDLINIWNDYPSLQKNNVFSKCMSARKEVLTQK